MTKHILFFVTILITVVYGVMAFGADTAVRVDASSTAIPAAFTANNASSEVITCLSRGKAAVWNASASWVSLGIGTATTAAVDVQAVIPPTTGYNFELIAPNQTVYIKGTDGAISTSYVSVLCGSWY